MARSKPSAKRPASTRKSDAQARAEQLSKSLSESAQQIWLAGVGAFGRAQAEGGRLFDSLVKEGASLEDTARRFAGQGEAVREAVEQRVGQARERASDTWNRLEKGFETRVHQALASMGVPGRDELHELSQRVDELTAELRRQRGAASRSRAKPAATAAKPRPARAKAAPAAPKAARAPRKTAARKATKPPAR